MARGQRKHATREEAEETRHTILRMAQQLFMEQGYRAVTTRQIADACGLTQPALYHYFSDKQDLYVAVMLEVIAQTKAALERIVRRNEGVEERLRQITRYLLSTTEHDISMMLHDIHQELAVQAQQQLTSAFQNGLIAPIAALFQEGIEGGLLRDKQQGGVDARTTTYLFMSMLRSLSSNQADISLPIHMSERADSVVQVLLHGIANTGKNITYPVGQERLGF